MDCFIAAAAAEMSAQHGGIQRPTARGQPLEAGLFMPAAAELQSCPCRLQRGWKAESLAWTLHLPAWPGFSAPVPPLEPAEDA